MSGSNEGQGIRVLNICHLHSVFNQSPCLAFRNNVFPRSEEFCVFWHGMGGWLKTLSVFVFVLVFAFVFAFEFLAIFASYMSARPWDGSCVARLLYTPATLVWVSDTLSSRGGPHHQPPPPRNNLYFSAQPNCISLLCQTVFLQFAKLYFSNPQNCISPICKNLFLQSAKLYFFTLPNCISPICKTVFLQSAKLYFSNLQNSISPICKTVFLQSAKLYFSNLQNCISSICKNVFLLSPQTYLSSTQLPNYHLIVKTLFFCQTAQHSAEKDFSCLLHKCVPFRFLQ